MSPGGQCNVYLHPRLTAGGIKMAIHSKENATSPIRFLKRPNASATSACVFPKIEIVLIEDTLAPATYPIGRNLKVRERRLSGVGSLTPRRAGERERERWPDCCIFRLPVEQHEQDLYGMQSMLHPLGRRHLEHAYSFPDCLCLLHIGSDLPHFYPPARAY